MICKICGREFDRNKGLAQHIRHSHKLTAKEYYLKYIDPDAGRCCCCGNPTPFYSIREGFQKHCSTSCANSDEESITKANEAKRSFSEEKRADIRARTKKTCDDLYGGIGFASEELREKGRQTNELVNGSRTYNNREKCEQTWIERTGYKSNLAIPENQEQFKRIKFERHGDENYNNRKKCAETNLNLYDNVCPANSIEGRKKAIQTMIENSGSVEQSYADRVKKSKETKRLRYDDENYNNSKQASETNLKIHGCRYPFALGKYTHSYSKGEKQVAKFVCEIYDGIILENDRDTLKPNEVNGWKSGHELDVYMPDISLAIEYNGDYYHNYELFPDRKIVDEQKQKECVQLGIRLLTIWEHEWKKDEKSVKEIIIEEIKRARNDKRNEKIVSDDII